MDLAFEPSKNSIITRLGQKSATKNLESFLSKVTSSTVAGTTLGTKGVGDRVNLEFDIVAKYVERMTEFIADN